MAPTNSKEKFDDAVRSMDAIGIPRKTVSPVLKSLLKLYDYNWEHIEADNFRVLTDAIFDDPDPEEGQKRQANERKNLVSDQGNKKLQTKHQSQKATSKTHGNDKKELAEVPPQQEASKLCTQTVREGNATGNKLQLSSSRLLIKEPNKESDVLEDSPIDEDSSALSLRCQDLPTFEVPLAVMCPQVQDSSHHRGYNHAKYPSAVAGGQSSSSNMQAIQHQPISAKGPSHDVNDITKCEEHVSIPIISVGGNGILPPPFYYIPHNITFQNAYINHSLARIGDGSCCSDCFGDCLAEPLPCACATETGGEFAYTREGLLKEGFLDSCISMLREPHKHPPVYCKICPYERVKIEVNSDTPNTKKNPDPCKGHLTRKFIKECWSKCGCTKNCGNRVVQSGITRPLQVFLTSGKKGWGLRAAEELPRGAFICEYVGEILTNTELYERTIKKTGKDKHTYPVLLDADWFTEGVLADDHALCLDATFYGNVARFINHRCFDANIIGIPVEIETPDHHYYHLAFFTTRQTEPFEELTWDYGIDFNDVNHPVKAFKCRCGSEFCRCKRSISRPKSRALLVP